MDVEGLYHQLTNLYTDAELLLPERVAQRHEALRLCAVAEEVGRLAGGRGQNQRLLRLAREVRAHVAEINARHFDRWRAAIRAGELRGLALREMLDAFTAYRPTEAAPLHLGADTLDLVIQGVLRLEPPPQATSAPEPGMIHLEHTPARVVLEMVDRVPLTAGDVFVDIGSGLGHVAILVHLLTGAKTEGIEVEPAYVALARDRARELGLEQVRFVCADARQANLTAGTVFFLFAPFFGTMLEEVIARLRQRAHAGPITVCSYGPSSPVLAQAAWLRAMQAEIGHPFRLTILRSDA